MKGKISILMIAFLLVFSLVACSTKNDNKSTQKQSGNSEINNTSKDKEQEADKSEPVTITYANFNASGGNEETLQKMYEAFHSQYPNITVEIETIGYSDYFTQMQTRVAGGTAPDSYELNIENFAAYANKGVLAEIAGVDLSGLNDTALNAFNVDGK